MKYGRGVGSGRAGGLSPGPCAARYTPYPSFFFKVPRDYLGIWKRLLPFFFRANVIVRSPVFEESGDGEEREFHLGWGWAGSEAKLRGGAGTGVVGVALLLY